jgi:hypothetical protein
MATLTLATRVDSRLATIALRSLVVGLTLATAAIHASLGGLLFTANAVVYTTLAIAMILPGPLGQVRWLVRIALMGFAAATIAGWLLVGIRFQLAYIDKTIEVVLIAALAIELWRTDGGPIGIVRRARRLLIRLSRTQAAGARR